MKFLRVKYEIDVWALSSFLCFLSESEDRLCMEDVAYVFSMRLMVGVVINNYV